MSDPTKMNPSTWWSIDSDDVEECCGYCLGSGRVPGPQYDREGRHRPEWPEWLRCEYCGGSGACAEGEKLLPARRPPRD